MKWLGALLALAAFCSACDREAPPVNDVKAMNEGTQQILAEIRRDCELGGYLIVEREGELWVDAEPTIRQRPLAAEKLECAKRLIHERLGRELAQPPASPKVLIIEFTDDSFKEGRIEGEGAWQPFPAPDSDGITPNGRDRFLQQISDCGAVNPVFVPRRTYLFYVISQSTARDREVVACLKRKIRGRFTAGIGVDDPRETFSDNALRRDTIPFSEFESGSN